VSNIELAAERRSAINVPSFAQSAPEAPDCISPRIHLRPVSSDALIDSAPLPSFDRLINGEPVRPWETKMTKFKTAALSSMIMLAGLVGCSSTDVNGDNVGSVRHVVR
jgi:hypothetical protein